jgi:hypothetical protein
MSRHRPVADLRLTAGLGVWLAWAVLRLVGLALLTGNAGYPQVDVSVFEYQGWAQLLFAGHVPWRGFMVEYPPGVFPAMLLPGKEFVYELEFIVLALIVDAVVVRMLLRRGRRYGAWCWCLMPIALGPLMWVRFDIFVAALLVGFVLSVSERRPRAAALCVAAAALLKLWPIILIGLGWFALPRADRRRFLTWAVAATSLPVVAVMTVGGTSGLLRMLSFQGGRGLEVESLWAVPYAVAHSVLAGPWPVQAHGSGEYAIAGLRAGVIDAVMPLALLLFAAAWWARRRSEAPLQVPHALLGIVAVLLATAKTLSAQYALWAVAAVVVVLDQLPDHQRRRLVLATVGYVASTQLLFPFAWWHLMFNDTTGVIATVLHGELLIVWVVVALTTCFSADSQPLRERAELPAEAALATA